MYRNIYYSPKEKNVTVWDWTPSGERRKRKVPFKPYLFIETSNRTKYQSVYGGNLTIKKFENSWEKKRFLDSYEGKVYLNLPPEQQYLLTTYWKKDNTTFSENPMRIFYLDIECPSKDEFPEPSQAKIPINVISVYDSLAKKVYIWGEKKFDPEYLKTQDIEPNKYIPELNSEDVVYQQFDDEVDLLEAFIDFWSENYPDIVTNWNGESFDIPYIINRIKRLIDADAAKRLSPVGELFYRQYLDKFGNETETYKIKGISLLDYLNVYKTFTFNKERESWNLNSVASDELDMGKVEHESSNLWTLANDDWSKFVYYNIQDVMLLAGLENSKKFLEFARVCAYEGLCPMEDAVGKSNIITGAVAKMALGKGKLIHTQLPKPKEKFPGGFVKEPDYGIKTDLISFDITSLYPTNMMACNMSHETKIGKVLNWEEVQAEPEEKYFVQFFSGNRKKMTRAQFRNLCRKESYAVSGAGIMFSQTKSGIVADFVSFIFNKKQAEDDKKSELRDQLSERLKVENPDTDYQIETVLLQEAIDRCEMNRNLWKVLANSIFGIVGTNTSALYDLDIARSTTLTGQAVIKRSYEVIETFAKSMGVKGELVVASDTDSMMISLTELLKTPTFKSLKLFEADYSLSKSGEKFLDALQHKINKEVNGWAKQEMFVCKSLYNFNREKVCPSALLVAKKNYAYWVTNDEGKNCDKIKYTGLKTIKSEFSVMVRGMLDDFYTYILKNWLETDEMEIRKELGNKAKEFRKEFDIAEMDDIVLRKKTNKIGKYSKLFTGPFKAPKKCPWNVKASVLYNNLLTHYGIRGKFPEILSGTKVKIGYVEANTFDIDKIAYFDSLPEEFGLVMSKDIMFEKLIQSPIDQAYEILNWRKPKIAKDDAVDLWSFFSE